MTATQSSIKKILSALAACIAAVIVAAPRLDLPVQIVNLLGVAGVVLGILGASPVATTPANDTVKKILAVAATLVGLASGGQLLTTPLPAPWATVVGVVGVILGVFGASPLGRVVWTNPVEPPKPTPAVLGIVFILAFGVQLGCTTSQPPPPVITSTYNDCIKPEIQDLATHLVDDAASALVLKDYKIALQNIAIHAGANGIAAVRCAVAQLFADTGKQLEVRARMDPATAERTQAIHDHAAAYLAAPAQ